MHKGVETEVQLDEMFNLTAILRFKGTNSIAESLLFTLYVAGLLAYVPVIFMFVKYRKKTFANPLYKLALALGACDILMLGSAATTTVSGAFRLFDLTVRSGIWIGVFIYCVGFFETMLMVLIAVNRLCSIKFHTKYERIFSNQMIVVYFVAIGVLEVFATGFMFAPMHGCGPHCTMKPEGYSYRLYCEEFDMLVWVNSIHFGLAVVLVVTYAYMFWTVKHMRMNKKTAKRAAQERRMLIQLGMVTSVFCSIPVMVLIVPLLAPPSIHSLLTALSVLGNSAMNPLCYLIFNHDLQKKLLGSTKPVVPTSFPHAKHISRSSIPAQRNSQHRF